MLPLELRVELEDVLIHREPRIPLVGAALEAADVRRRVPLQHQVLLDGARLVHWPEFADGDRPPLRLRLPRPTPTYCSWAMTEDVGGILLF